MLAARIHKAGDLRLENISHQKRPARNEVKVRVLAAGICGSDLHVYQTGAYLTRTPITMGHEFSGQVVEVGEENDGFRIDDYVVGDSRVFCGTCRYCNEHRHNLCENLGFLGEACDGAFAEEIIIPAASLLKIHSGVPVHIAALAEPLAVALHAVNLSKIQKDKGKRILILGAGPVGALLHTVLLIQGVGDVTVVDISKYRRNAILETGNDCQVADIPQGKYDLIFETTGSSHVLQKLLFSSLVKGGTAILVGLFAQENSFDFTEIVEHEWRIKGCSCFDKELPAAVKLLERHNSAFEYVVSHQLKLAEIQSGFDILLSAEKPAMKIVLKP